MFEAAVAQMQALRLDNRMLSAVRLMADALGPHLDWRRLGRIPGRLGPARKRPFRTAGAGGQYVFLERVPNRDVELEELRRTHGPTALLLFRLLCLSEAVEMGAMAGAVDAQLLAQLVELGLLIRDEEHVVAAVRFVPYGDSFYLADSLLLGDNQILHDCKPVYLNFETHEQVVYLRKLLGKRKVTRTLEVGCGTGLVSLELRSHAAFREGADRHERSVSFARINQELHGDSGARFYESDLLAAAEGQFDLVFFNPFQIDEAGLPFLERFLLESFGHLGAEGLVVLVFHARADHQGDPVFTWIERFARQNQRDLRRTFFESSVGEDGSVRSISFLALTPARRASTVSTTPNVQLMLWLLRRAYARCRGRLY